MRMKKKAIIYPNVNIEKNFHLEEGVILGYPLLGKKEGEISLKIGKRAFIRSGTVIYAGSRIGDSFQCGHNAVIREGNIIGNKVSIGVHVYLGPENEIGNNVKIHTGSFLEMVMIEDDVFIGPHVVFTNDPNPPCKECTQSVRGARVKRGVAVGANVTILPGVEVGEGALIGAGSVVTENVPTGLVVVGNPARVLKKRDQIRHLHSKATI